MSVDYQMVAPRTRVFVREGDFNRTIEVFVFQGFSPDSEQILRIVDGEAVRWEATPEGARTEPSFFLDREVGRELLDSLAAHYGAGSDIRQMNDQLKIERGRVDRLIGYVGESLALLAAPEPPINEHLIPNGPFIR